MTKRAAGLSAEKYVKKDVLLVYFSKMPGTVESAPYFDVVFEGYDGRRSKPVKMRMDTGADISVAPGGTLDSVLLKTPVLVSTYNGEIQRCNTHDVTIILLDSNGYEMWRLHPSRGVLTTRNAAYGLLGMDVLRNFRIIVEDDHVSLKKAEQECPVCNRQDIPD